MHNSVNSEQLSASSSSSSLHSSSSGPMSTLATALSSSSALSAASSEAVDKQAQQLANDLWGKVVSPAFSADSSAMAVIETTAQLIQSLSSNYFKKDFAPLFRLLAVDAGLKFGQFLAKSSLVYSEALAKVLLQNIIEQKIKSMTPDERSFIANLLNDQTAILALTKVLSIDDDVLRVFKKLVKDAAKIKQILKKPESVISGVPKETKHSKSSNARTDLEQQLWNAILKGLSEDTSEHGLVTFLTQQIYPLLPDDLQKEFRRAKLAVERLPLVERFAKNTFDGTTKNLLNFLAIYFSEVMAKHFEGLTDEEFDALRSTLGSEKGLLLIQKLFSFDVAAEKQLTADISDFKEIQKMLDDDDYLPEERATVLTFSSDAPSSSSSSSSASATRSSDAVEPREDDSADTSARSDRRKTRRHSHH